jgi:hypothetical protein
VFGTCILASVVVRRVPSFGASALSMLSLITRARKTYAGSMNIRLSYRSSMRISPRAALNAGKQSPNVSLCVSVCSKRDNCFWYDVSACLLPPLVIIRVCLADGHKVVGHM